MVKPGAETIKNRPAETGGLAAAVVVLICYFAGVDNPGVIAALVIVVGAVPAFITWLVVTIRSRPPEPLPTIDETLAAPPPEPPPTTTTGTPPEPSQGQPIKPKTRAAPKSRKRKS
jgi:hypothetical protein